MDEEVLPDEAWVDVDVEASPEDSWADVEK